MNVDKINATLLTAISRFSEDEIRTMRSSGGGGGAELNGIEAPLARMAREVAEETGKPFQAALDAVVDGLSEAAARHFGGEEPTEQKLVEWLGSEGPSFALKQIAEQLR